MSRGDAYRCDHCGDIMFAAVEVKKIRIVPSIFPTFATEADTMEERVVKTPPPNWLFLNYQGKVVDLCSETCARAWLEQTVWMREEAGA